jgi:transposase InsO family protein
MTFLRNHRDLITGMDFFVVPTVRFQLLYVWFVIDHGRRRVLHFNVTESPTACWVIQQLRDAFPNDPAHHFLVLDNDAIFSPQVAASIQGLGLTPKRTAIQSPWQNGTAERFVGSVRRELLDHVVVLDAERIHTSIGDSPKGREPEFRPSSSAKVVALPRVGGLHHRYTWSDAV